MIVICPECNNKVEVEEKDIISNVDWKVKSDNKILKYVKMCSSCKSPIYINKNNYNEVLSTNKLIYQYGRGCLTGDLRCDIPESLLDLPGSLLELTKMFNK